MAGNNNREPAATPTAEAPGSAEASYRAFARLHASFAVAGREPRAVTKGEQHVHHGVRCGAEASTCSTVHDVRGTLAALTGGASP